MINYDRFADIYDIDMGYNMGKADIPFYLEYARKLSPVLELGCGTGRIMKPMLDENIPVTGIDGSMRMLDRTRRKLGEGYNGNCGLEKADLAGFNLEKDFMLAICAFSTYSKLLTVDEQKSFISSVYRHLRPGGIFLMEMFVNKADIKDGESILDYKDRWYEEKGVWITRRKKIWKDVEPQVNKIELEYRFREESGREEVLTLEDYTRYSKRDEILIVLREAGFEQIEIFSDYSKSIFQAGSDKMIFEARRGQ